MLIERIILQLTDKQDLTILFRTEEEKGKRCSCRNENVEIVCVKCRLKRKKERKKDV